MPKKSLTTAGLIAALLTAPLATGSASAAAADQSSAPATLDVVTVNGSGCPVSTAGSAKVTTSADRASFQIDFNSFEASGGPGISAIESRRNCQLALKVTPPAGFAYRLNQLDFTGSATIASGASALVRTSYYWQGMAQSNVSSHTFTGPFDDDWATSDRGDFDEPFSTCGEQRFLNINTELRITKGSSTRQSTITMDHGNTPTTGVFSLMRCR